MKKRLISCVMALSVGMTALCACSTETVESEETVVEETTVEETESVVETTETVIETEPAETLETAAEPESSAAEMYNAYLQVLQSNEQEIADAVDYFSEYSNLLPCSLVDINNDGIEELCFVTYSLRFNIYSYDEQTGSAYELGFIPMTYGTDVLFALSADGSIFEWSDGNFPEISEPFHDGEYDQYSADTFESIGCIMHCYEEDYYGDSYSFADSHDSPMRFYSDADGNITSEVIDEFNQTTSGLLDSMTVLLVNSGGADRDFNNERINEATAGIESAAMTYEDMITLLSASAR